MNAHLGGAGLCVELLGPTDGDDLLLPGGDEGLSAQLVDVGEPLDLAGAQMGVGHEEAEVLAGCVEGLVEPDQAIAVIIGDRADLDARDDRTIGGAALHLQVPRVGLRHLAPDREEDFIVGAAVRLEQGRRSPIIVGRTEDNRT